MVLRYISGKRMLSRDTRILRRKPRTVTSETISRENFEIGRIGRDGLDTSNNFS